MSGRRWELNGLISRFLSATANLTHLRIARLDLSKLLMTNTSSELDVSRYLVEGLNDTEPLQSPTWANMNTNDGYPEAWIGHHVSWTNTIIIIVICIGLICVGGYIYKRREKVKFFFKDALLNRASKSKIAKYNKQNETVLLTGVNTLALEEVEQGTADLGTPQGASEARKHIII